MDAPIFEPLDVAKPSELTGVIFEFIERGAYGFCKENVKALMESTKGN